MKTLRKELSEFTALFGDTFGRSEPKELFDLYFQGLLSTTERKNVEAMAMNLDGPDRVRNLQRLMCDYIWDEKLMHKKHLELSAESLSDPQGVWSVDASEIPKKGEESVGVYVQIGIMFSFRGN